MIVDKLLVGEMDRLARQMGWRAVEVGEMTVGEMDRFGEMDRLAMQIGWRDGSWRDGQVGEMDRSAT